LVIPSEILAHLFESRRNSRTASPRGSEAVPVELRLLDSAAYGLSVVHGVGLSRVLLPGVIQSPNKTASCISSADHGPPVRPMNVAPEVSWPTAVCLLAATLVETAPEKRGEYPASPVTLVVGQIGTGLHDQKSIGATLFSAPPRTSKLEPHRLVEPPMKFQAGPRVVSPPIRPRGRCQPYVSSRTAKGRRRPPWNFHRLPHHDEAFSLEGLAKGGDGREPGRILAHNKYQQAECRSLVWLLFNRRFFLPAKNDPIRPLLSPITSAPNFHRRTDMVRWVRRPPGNCMILFLRWNSKD